MAVDRSFIVFVDETGFMLSPTIRRTWAPRGQTPHILVTQPHGKISAAGAMIIRRRPIRFSFYFQLLQDNANYNGAAVAGFLRGLRRSLVGSITIVWDEYCIHRSQPVRQFIASAEQMEVEELPPYAPELNPVDFVWSYVKYGRLANYCSLSLMELRRKVTAELNVLASQPGLLRGLFSRSGLSLD